MHRWNFFPTLHIALLQMFCWSNWIQRANGRLDFWKDPANQCTKMLPRENLCFFTQNVQKFRKINTWKPVSTSELPMLWKLWTHFLRETQSQRNFYGSRSVSKTKKRLGYSSHRDLHFLVRTWVITLEFWKQCFQWSWSFNEKEKTSPASVCLAHCLHTFSDDIDSFDCVQ